MKKSIYALMVAMAFWGKSHALSPVYTGDLINTAVCADSTTVLSLNQYQIGYLSFQTVASSGTYAASTFTDGRSSTASITVASNTNFTIRASTNSITVASTASLAPRKATDRITIASNTALSGAVLTVNGIQLIEGRDWTKQTTATGTAANLAAVLNVFPGMDASTGSSVIYATAALAGLAGNSFTMTSSTPAALTVLTANFTGGIENGLTNAVLTINGVAYRNGYLWTSNDGTGIDNSSMTATSIAAMINHITGLSATSASSVVYTTATTGGTAGNDFTITSSTSGMVVQTANYTGGRATTTVTINGTVLTNAVDWTTGATSSATAKSISDAIMANSSLNTIVRSTWNASAVVTSTSLAIGTVSNYVLTTNNSASLTVTGYSGGAIAAWTINTPTITVTGHGYPQGLGVVYSTGVIAISGLTNLTTYYVIPVDANHITLASSRANALAGTYILLASSSTTGQHTYTLTPQGIAGSASWKWQESNDNTNWIDLSVTTVTLSSPYAASSNFWDFGQLNPQYLRLNIVGTTAGCINLRAKGNGK